MNKLLQINKKLLLLILFSLSVLLIAVIVFKFNDNTKYKEIVNNDVDPIYDIINPRFIINNKNDKISVRAKGGNFLTDEKILLEKDVVFTSPKFKLLTEKVIFNQLDQSAESSEMSRFQSEDTIIVSEGFKINEQGDTIYFNGKTKLILGK